MNRTAFARGLVVPLALAAFAAPSAQAQDYPTKTITIICGYAPGAGVDIPIRYFAEKLRELAGKPVIVENRQGALTNIAAHAVARAEGDGYTMLITSGNSTMAANPHLFKELPFDPVKDFTPVTTLFRTTFVLVVNNEVPAKTVAELTAYMKKRGAAANYGYSGALGLATAELYKTLTGLETTQIAYKNPRQQIPDLMSGRIEWLFQAVNVVLPQVRAGKFRALAVTPAERTAIMPDLPTMAEAGVKGYDLSGWFGVWLPARAPAPVVEKLNTWFNRILKTEETGAFLLKNGLDRFPGSPKSLASFQAEETVKWGKILKAAKVEPQ